VASAVPPRRRARADERANGRPGERQRVAMPTSACSEAASVATDRARRLQADRLTSMQLRRHGATVGPSTPRTTARSAARPFPFIAAGGAREVGSTNGNRPLARSRRRTTTDAATRPPTRGDRARPELRATREPASRCRAATTSGARLSPLR